LSPGNSIGGSCDAEDFLSFSNISRLDAADIFVRLDNGESASKSLYVYAEGVICSYIAINSEIPVSVNSDTNIFAAHSKKLEPVPEYFSVSQDIIHQIQKILFPDIEKDYQALTMEPIFVKSDDVNPGDVNEIPLFIPLGRNIFTMSDGFIAFSSVWDGSDADPFLRTVKYDEQGNILWTKDYPNTKLERMGYGHSEIIETKDGGFAFL